MKGLVFLLLIGISVLSCEQSIEWNGSDVSGMLPDLEFTLTGTDGQPVNAEDLRGKPVLLFFGFTNCPDTCPTTLTQLSIARKKLGDDANKLQIALVSVDPDRDTPEVMHRYTASFGPWLLGLTGSPEALESLRKTYGVYAAMESSDSKGNYNVMHNAVVFAFDSDGRLRVLIKDVSNSDAVVSDLRNLIKL